MFSEIKDLIQNNPEKLFYKYRDLDINKELSKEEIITCIKKYQNFYYRLTEENQQDYTYLLTVLQAYKYDART
jgi:hypothetical protein